MKIQAARALLAIFIGLGVGTAAAVAAPVSGIDAAAVNRWLDQRVEPDGTAGRIGPGVIEIVDHGRIIVSRVYGVENDRLKLPVSADRSLFRLASTSKVFTATAIAQLVERGKIRSIEDPVNLYLK